MIMARCLVPLNKLIKGKGIAEIIPLKIIYTTID
jgi:hypothetical protein